MSVSAAPLASTVRPMPVDGTATASVIPTVDGRSRAAVDVPQPTPDTVPTPPPTPDIDDPTVPPEVVEPPPQPGEQSPVGDPMPPSSARTSPMDRVPTPA